MTNADYAAVIGLEVHCQLGTRTKLFCGCRNTFGEPPNTHVCPVCSGQPGALPVLNEAAVRLAVRAALAVEGTIRATSDFDRKNYFYCDLPKGYQITQFDAPYCQGGGVRLASGRTVRLRRIHLEEDAGKAIHDRGDATLVDLNRAGVPLIEAVTEADLQTADEAHEFLTALKEMLRFAGVSDCDMEKGSLRCDVNVSLHRPGEPWGTKVELKNLNSFRFVRDSLEHEIARQSGLLERGAGHEIRQETRLWDADRAETRVMRSKEDADDYRYFPEPDLPALVIPATLIEAERAALPELPAAKRARYTETLGLSAYDADLLSSDPVVAHLFEAALEAAASPKSLANLIANEVVPALAEPAVRARAERGHPVAPADLARVTREVESGAIHANGGRRVLELLVRGDERDVDRILQEEHLLLVTDEAALERWCRQALVGREDVAREVRAGKTKAIGALMGAVMKASHGQAAPERVRALLQRMIDESEA